MTIATIDIISRAPGALGKRANTGLRQLDQARENIKAEATKVDGIYWLSTFNEVHQKRIETLITVNVKLRNVKLGVIHGAGKVQAAEKQMTPLDSSDATVLQFLTRRTWCSV